MTLLRMLPALLLAGSLAGQAQSQRPGSDSSGRWKQAYHWVAKVAPLSLVDPDNTVQFGAERMLANRNAVQGEFGYGWQGMNLWRYAQTSPYSNRETWRGRAEWRYYARNSPGPIGRYFALEVFYKQVNALANGSVGVGCQNGPCQYYELYSSPIRKSVWGSHAKIGWQFSMDPSRRLLGDLYLGLGVRQRTVRQLDEADGLTYFQPRRSLFDPFYPPSLTVVSIAFGVKIGYRLD